jgi:hypothetical protein
VGELAGMARDAGFVDVEHRPAAGDRGVLEPGRPGSPDSPSRTVGRVSREGDPCACGIGGAATREPGYVPSSDPQDVAAAREGARRHVARLLMHAKGLRRAVELAQEADREGWGHRRRDRPDRHRSARGK